MQFCKLAKAAGFNSHVDHADDIFNQVAEKVMVRELQSSDLV
jgi:hypothetical protein